MFQRSFNDVSRELGGCFKEVSKLFKEGFKEIERKIKGVLGVSMIFQDSFKEVSRVF